MNTVRIVSRTQDKNLVNLIAEALPRGNFERIMIKPNWVIHESNPAFPIKCLVTDAHLIDSTIIACLEAYPTVKRITVGDVPLQICDFEKLQRQSGIDRLREKYSRMRLPVVEFCDLRKERWRLSRGYIEMVDDLQGDPRGYSMIRLDGTSMLDEISKNATRFRVADYDPVETISAHRSGHHAYMIARSVLESELFINMPKMKTHQKAGVTGALKNLVGINGSKSFLVHHQLGKPSQGGDEFSEDASPWIILQTRLRSLVQKRSPIWFYPMKWGWEAVKKLRGISTLGTKENLAGAFYVGSGSWYGNDSIWRMVYDLNSIVLFAPTDGDALRSSPQREYFCVLDAIVAGEGNGPLQALPVDLGAIVLGDNPFLVDAIVAKMMGFDWRKIPLLRHIDRFRDQRWRDVDFLRFPVVFNDSLKYNGIQDVPVFQDFVPPPGWKNHVELSNQSTNA